MSKRIETTPEAIGERLRTQDNAITAEPLFVLEETELIWGVDASHHEDDVVYRYVDRLDSEIDESTYLDALVQLTEHGVSPHKARGRIRRVACLQRWKFVTAALTRAALEEYREANAHNLQMPTRIYVYSAHRNREWKAMRAHFLAGVPW